MSDKKITGNVSLSLTAVVQEVTQTANGHQKHQLGYVCVAQEDEKVYQNWQFFTYASGDKEARVYPPGTVLTLTFKHFSIYTSEKGGTYLTPDFPQVTIVKWGQTEQTDATPQPPKYNKSSKKGSDYDTEGEFAF